MVAIVAVLLGGIGAFCGALVNVLGGVNLAAAATAHVSRDAAARFLVTSFNSRFEHVFSSVYFVGISAAPVLMGVALWRSRSVPRWRAVLFVIGLEVAQQVASVGTQARGGAHAPVCGGDAAAGGPGVASCDPASQPRQCPGGGHDARTPG